MSDTSSQWRDLWKSPSTALGSSVPSSLNMSSETQNKSNGSEGSDPAQPRPVPRAMPAASSSGPPARSIGQLIGSEAEAFYE
eukprot:3886804-Heterocapsa_arctica.AAC.1